MNEKTRKFVNVMYKILGVAPIIASAVFTILFMFVLKDRTEERILHSATTFLLWMFATIFYIMIVAFFKNKKKLLFSPTNKSSEERGSSSLFSFSSKYT